MELRTAEYRSVSLGAFLLAVKHMTIPVEYVHDNNGQWSCWTKPGVYGAIDTFGAGGTLDEAKADYVNALKDIAECIYDDYSVCDERVSTEFLMKVLLTSREELIQCLDGETCGAVQR